MRDITKVVFIEDGSISDQDIEALKKLGFTTIVYRQGSAMPEMRCIDLK